MELEVKSCGQSSIEIPLQKKIKFNKNLPAFKLWIMEIPLQYKINFGQNFFKDKQQITASNGSYPHRENIKIAKGFIAIDSYT